MRETAIYPLRLPKPLKEAVAKAAKRDAISVNQFIVIAVAEKLSALKLSELVIQLERRLPHLLFWRSLT